MPIEFVMKWGAFAFIALMMLSGCLQVISAIQKGEFGFRYIRSLTFLESLVGLIMFVMFFFGVGSFPDAPYNSCPTEPGYCGKWGIPHSFEEYRLYSIWQTVILITWPIGMILLFAINRFRKSRRNIEG